jgi:enoyl-CoA hydratase/carnithine racemase
MNDSQILLSRDTDGVRTLTLNRPDKRNALNTPLVEALLAGLDAADHDAEVGTIVLTGAGALFCAGADVGEFRDAGSDTAAASERRSDLLLELFLRFSTLRPPVIAAVNGAALGAGVAVALAADMVVMSAEAKLGYPETKHGMVPSLMAGLLVHNIGRKAAFELLALGDLLDAKQALARGLVNRVVAPNDVQTEALALAARLAALDRFAVEGTKRVLTACADLALPEALRKGRELGKRLKAERA